MQLFKIPEWFVWGSFIATFLATLWKGSWQTRVISGLQLGWMILLRAWIFFTGHSIGGWHHERWWVYVAQDFMFFAIAVLCSRTARRYWVLWAAAVMLDGLTTDLLNAFTHVVTPWAYKWASYIWTYASLLMCWGDVWANVRAGRAGGAVAGRPPSVAA